MSNIDPDLLHQALREVTPGSYGTGHVADERREIDAIIAKYDELVGVKPRSDFIALQHARGLLMGFADLAERRGDEKVTVPVSLLRAALAASATDEAMSDDTLRAALDEAIRLTRTTSKITSQGNLAQLLVSTMGERAALAASATDDGHLAPCPYADSAEYIPTGETGCTCARPAVPEALDVAADNMLRHHNATCEVFRCEFGRQLLAALTALRSKEPLPGSDWTDPKG